MQVKFVRMCLSRSWDTGVADTIGRAIPAKIGRRALWVAVMLCAFPGVGVLAQDTPGIPVLTLTEARALARRVHPAIRAARQAVEATAGLERQSGAFPNPTVSFAREQTSWNGGTNWQNIAMFSQPIEIGGQRGARQDAARHRRTAADARRAAVEAQIDFEVGRAYALAVAADYRVARTAEAADVFGRAREIGAARLAEGDISGYEYRRIALEAGRYAVLEAEVMLARDAARLSLATLLAPSSDSISIFAAEMRLLESIATVPIDESFDSLIALAFQRRPDLRAVGLEVEASVADARLASRQAVPTPTVALGFKNERATTDLGVSKGFVLQVALPLPLWDRRRGATDAARAETQKVEAEREDLRRNVAREVEHAWRMLAAVTEQLNALRPLLGAEAQLALQAAGTAYTEGEISLVEWLDAVRAYHEAQSTFATLQADHVIRFMTLERAVGSVPSRGIEQ
ncbi:MAG: TolC family protein [Gemmatimonadales bacterium]